MHDHGNCERCDAQEAEIARLTAAHICPGTLAAATTFTAPATDAGRREIARLTTALADLRAYIGPPGGLPYEELVAENSRLIRDLEERTRERESLRMERDAMFTKGQRDNEHLIGQRDAAEGKAKRLREALEPFASGGEWGKVKAWIVEGTRVLDKVSDGLDAAQRITRWQVAVDAALSGVRAGEEARCGPS